MTDLTGSKTLLISNSKMKTSPDELKTLLEYSIDFSLVD